MHAIPDGLDTSLSQQEYCEDLIALLVLIPGLETSEETESEYILYN